METLNGNLVGLKTVTEPPEGRYAIVIPGIVFVSGAEQFDFSSQSLKTNKLINSIQTVWVDASKCTQGLNVYLVTELQTIVIPGGKQGFYAVTGRDLPFLFSVIADAGLAGEVKLNLYNFAVLPGESQTIQTISGAVTSNQGNGGNDAWKQNVAEIGGEVISLGQKYGDESIPVVEAAKHIVSFGQQNVAAAAGALAAHVCSRVTVKALSGNANPIFIGGAGVTPASGYELKASESKELFVADVSEVYVVSAAGGEKICWIAED